MKQLELKDIQKECLNILKDVHHFCETNGIRYSLAYGTLLGAIRHKGIIPWDDDIDIMMPRPDYERFCKTYKSNLFKIAPPKESYISFARVYDDRRTVFETITPWTPNPCGVNIDIFPLDAVSDNFADFSHIYKKLYRSLMILKRHRDTITSLRKALLYLSLPKQWKMIPKLIIKKLMYSNYSPANLIAEINTISQQHEWGSTSHIAQMVCADNGVDHSWFESSWMDKIILKDFETEQFYVTADYDKMLTLMFGDYNTPPPPSMQVVHTNGRYFYKDKNLLNKPFTK